MSRDTLIGPRIRHAWQPGETWEEWATRGYEEMRRRVQAIPRTKRAYDRGNSDAYYGRFNEAPHIWDDGVGRVVITEADMTEDEVAEYYRGFNENPSDRKDWG